MDLAAAQQLAHQLMQQHGLHGWSFRFDHARRRLGACHYTTHTITLSRHLARINSEAVVRDTILHEIAHALTPGGRHGAAWRARARAIGANPKACADADEVELPAAPFDLVCDRCGTRVARYRRSRQRYVCRSCYAAHEAGLAPYPPTLRLEVRSSKPKREAFQPTLFAPLVAER
jgi:predicted SprT family Zn-dependent metalloprotease